MQIVKLKGWGGGGQEERWLRQGGFEGTSLATFNRRLKYPATVARGLFSAKELYSVMADLKAYEAIQVSFAYFCLFYVSEPPSSIFTSLFPLSLLMFQQPSFLILHSRYSQLLSS